MMPVIRLNDATFADLKSIATWLETETPSKTIDSLVRKKMNELDLERDEGDLQIEVIDSGNQVMVFDHTPGLSFTRILSATIYTKRIEKSNWASLLLEMVGRVKAKGMTSNQLVNELQVPAKAESYEEDGYKFHPEIGISIQGQSAPDAWKEVSRLANKFRISVEVEFQWRDNDGAQHPGRIGIIRAGK